MFFVYVYAFKGLILYVLQLTLSMISILENSSFSQNFSSWRDDFEIILMLMLHHS